VEELLLLMVQIIGLRMQQLLVVHFTSIWKQLLVILQQQAYIHELGDSTYLDFQSRYASNNVTDKVYLVPLFS